MQDRARSATPTLGISSKYFYYKIRENAYRKLYLLTH
jgi:hypothetical protein